MDRNEPEILADWLLDVELTLSTTTSKPSVKQSIKTAPPAINWHSTLEAEEVYYFSKNIHALKCGKLPCIQSIVDTDSCKFKGTFLIQYNYCH